LDSDCRNSAISEMPLTIVAAGEEVQTPEQLEKLLVELEEEMLAAAEDLRFEEAARIRDELKELRRDLDAMRA